MRRMQGFTLIELMIVVAVIGILSMFAYPSYTEYITRGKIQEATSTLADLRVKMEQYYMDNRRYNAAATVCGVPMPVAPMVRYFAYTCASATPVGAAANEQTYTITATGCSAAGTPATCGGAEGMGGFVLTINQGNTKATTGVGTGWNAAGLPLNCWVQKKAGTC